MSVNLRRHAAAICGGLVLATAFPDVNFWPAAIVGLAMFSLVIRNVGLRGSFGLGWVFGMAFFLPHLWWAFVAVGWIPWIALAATQSVAVGLAALVITAWRRTWGVRWPWTVAAVTAFAWTAAELLRSAVPFGGFPWGRVAFAMADAPLVRLAWLGGAPLVSLAVAYAGALLAQSLLAFREHRPVRGLVGLVAIALGLLAPLGIPLDTRAQQGELTVVWVQGNLADEGLDSFQNAREVTLNHLEATENLAATGVGPVDLVIWPENAADIDPRADADTADIMTAAAQAFDAPVILGTNDFSPEVGRYNSSIVWMPDGTQLEGEVYNKQVPAAFAEYIPIRSFARQFSSAVDRITTDVIPGDTPAQLIVPGQVIGRDVVVGPVICFEVAYDWVPREAADLGAEFLAVQTNNATFGPTPESTQQLAMSRLRAIETGLTTLQVSTVGVSAVIEADGTVVQRSELFTQDAGVATIALRTSSTPAVKWGSAISWAILGIGSAIALLGFGASLARPRRRAA